MSDDVFDSAAERIAFSEAVDFIEQGRAGLIPPERVSDYVGLGLLERRGDALHVTEAGLQQHKIAVRERFPDG